ncbi:MAG: A/G-specific adenine glycosylase [Aestuariivita sp.]|nr:A/G-specific adenine glycosylase [Aestuariivita sp.]
MDDIINISDLLINWYDKNARILPWRVLPRDRLMGKKADPYYIWISEIMLQQTTVATVKNYYRRFIELWPTVIDLANANETEVMGEWAGLGYYARARNLVKCSRIITNQMNGQFPRTAHCLMQLPGIGPYTAAAIAAIAFNHQETVVDGNVERVISRMFNIHDPLPISKPKIKSLAAKLTPVQRPGDYAQAIMDLGATICTPRKPNCQLCPWHNHCLAKVAGTATQLPRKSKKKIVVVRKGHVYIGRRQDGAWLMESRPNKGLLGGMLGWPGTDWLEVRPEESPPCKGSWECLSDELSHTFTHFHLLLRVHWADLPNNVTPTRGFFLNAQSFNPSTLPTLMQKAYNAAFRMNNWR